MNLNPLSFSLQTLQTPVLSLYHTYDTLTNPLYPQSIIHQQAYQLLLAKARTSKLMQIKNLYLNQLQTDIKTVPKGVGGFGSLQQAPLLASLMSNNKFDQISPLSGSSPIEAQTIMPIVKIPNTNNCQNDYKTLRQNLEKMISAVLSQVGRDNLKGLQNFRSLYSNDAILAQIFDKLVRKYNATRKCKEDIIRYVLRKALKNIRNALSKKEKVVGKKSAFLLCKKYFHSRFEAMEKAGINMENEDELLEFILPYRKNSKNRTMNSQFVEEIFSSNEFCEEYENFLSKFNLFLQEDNAKKTKKFIDFIILCIQEGNLSKIDSFNRLPWLELWLEDTKKIAFGLLPEKRRDNLEKKVKRESN